MKNTKTFLLQQAATWMISVLLAWPLMVTAQQSTSVQEAQQQKNEVQATSDSLPAITEKPEVIVVTGHLPGPPLWKVSNGDNVLWIFGMLDRIPVGMQWDSARVERVLTEAEEYIAPPGRGIQVGLLIGLRLLNPISMARGWSLMKRLQHDPDGKPLQQTLTPALYQRFAALKTRYFPNNKDIEQYRPFIAMDNLAGEVMKHEGLGTSKPISDKIKKLANKQDKLQRTYPSVMTTLALGYGEIAERAETFMKSLPRDKELACFEQELSRMEVDTEAMKRRANAWAQGNIDEFREIELKTKEENPCVVMMAASSETELFGTLVKQANALWSAAAEQALTKRHSSFAVLGIEELLSDQGLLAQLQAKGYEVRQP